MIKSILILQSNQNKILLNNLLFHTSLKSISCKRIYSRSHSEEIKKPVIVNESKSNKFKNQDRKKEYYRFGQNNAETTDKSGNLNADAQDSINPVLAPMAKLRLYLTVVAALVCSVIISAVWFLRQRNPPSLSHKKGIDIKEWELLLGSGETMIKFATWILSTKIQLISPLLIKWMASGYKIDLSECEKKNLSDYETPLDLFTRRKILTPKPCDVKTMLISPCESKVIECGELVENKEGKLMLPFIGNIDFDVEHFLSIPDSEYISENKKKAFFYTILYLGPEDIHWFYSPSDFSLNTINQLNGFARLLAFSDGEKQNSIYSKIFDNHRLVLEGDWVGGKLFFTAVGALNVGAIFLSSQDKLYKNTYRYKEVLKEKTEIKYSQHQEIGYFQFGSTIVLIFEAPDTFKFTISPNMKLKIGDPLGSY